MLNRFFLLVMPFLASGVLQGERAKGILSLLVRDQRTGYGIQAGVRVFKGSLEIGAYRTDEAGRLSLEESPGEFTFLIEAPGYRPLKTHFLLEEGRKLEVKVYLDPIAGIIPSKEEKPPEEDLALYQGFVVDEEKGFGLEGVRVISKKTGSSTLTDSTGHFLLKLPAPKVKVGPQSPPPGDTLFFERKGYKTLELRNVFLIPGRFILKITLPEGEGKLIREKKHGLFSPESLPKGDGKPKGSSRSSHHGSPEEQGLILSLTFLDPPPSIRVGTDCSCTDCLGVSVMSLETYVQSGLDDEWLSSWEPHSLRAGAIAYRSYGAWHILNPIDPNYDICNSTCCQVWDPDEAQGTIDAAFYTSGLMLGESGMIARAEYSQENNNTGCGDCYSGTGSTWPCIYDPVCCGYEPAGHGRGMCQWGSERWANAQETWDWIAGHYYNPGGMTLSTPMMIQAAWPEPDTIFVGDSFVIHLQVYNGAEDPHSQIILGASLYREGQYIDDPPNDRKVTVDVGSSNLWRLFRTSDLIEPGSYDLLVSLWFDIDEDDEISASDLPLYLITLPDGIFLRGLFLCGDTNGDGWVNASDLNFLALYLFGGGEPPDPLERGDANGDCNLSTADLTFLALYLFDGGPAPLCCPTLAKG